MKRENKTKMEHVEQTEESCARKKHYWLKKASSPRAVEEIPIQSVQSLYHSEHNAVNMFSILSAPWITMYRQGFAVGRWRMLVVNV